MAKRRLYAAIVTIAIASAAILITFPLKAQTKAPAFNTQYEDDSMYISRCVLLQKNSDKEVMVNLKRVGYIETSSNSNVFFYTEGSRAVVRIDSKIQLVAIRRAFIDCTSN